MGKTTIELTGWTVEDEAGHVYGFSKGTTLDPGASTNLRTDPGSNTEADLYWGPNQPIWNNSHDTVFVNDTERTLVTSRSY